MRRFIREYADYPFSWACVLTRHAGACRIMNGWYNSAPYRWMWYRA